MDASTSYIENLENKSIKLEEHVIIDQYMLEIKIYRNEAIFLRYYQLRTNEQRNCKK